MLKDLLVYVDQKSPAARCVATDAGLAIAQMFGAHVTGLAIASHPAVPPTMFGALSSAFLNDIRTENDEIARAAASRFKDAAARAGAVFGAEVATSEDGDWGYVAAAIARRYDLTVVRQENEGDAPDQRIIIEGLLFGSGRPVFVVPYIHRLPLKLDQIAVCWDGSQHAARAISDALPFLRQAKKIEVVSVSSPSHAKEEKLPGVEIATHLARHGLNVTLRDLPGGDLDVGNILLSYTVDSSIDMLVMGGYGHSRLREFVLGGATETILKAMTLPVLLSH